jgi:hypothetical protein
MQSYCAGDEFHYLWEVAWSQVRSLLLLPEIGQRMQTATEQRSAFTESPTVRPSILSRPEPIHTRRPPA